MKDFVNKFSFLFYKKIFEAKLENLKQKSLRREKYVLTEEKRTIFFNKDPNQLIKGG